MIVAMKLASVEAVTHLQDTDDSDTIQFSQEKGDLVFEEDFEMFPAGFGF